MCIVAETFGSPNSSEIYSYTKAISNHVKTNDMTGAQELFDQMSKKGVEPDVVTYNILMKGYSSVGNVKRVLQLYEDIQDKDLEQDSYTFNIAILACANDRNLNTAMALFDSMQNDYLMVPDVYTYNALLKVCAASENLKEAKKIYNKMLSSGVQGDKYTLTILIDVYSECCNNQNGPVCLNECLELVKGMEENGIDPDKRMFDALLKLCARSDLAKESLHLLKDMKQRGLRPNVITYNTVFDGLSKDTKLSEKGVYKVTTNLLKEMEERGIRADTPTYNCLIRIALRMKELDKALDVFDQMKKRNIRRSSITYGCLLRCFEKLRNPLMGDEYLESCFKIVSDLENEGLPLRKEMCTSLLSACAKASNVKKANEVWNKMLSLGLKPDVYQYNAMIEVYTRSWKFNHAIKLAEEMKAKRIKKDVVTYGALIKCHGKLGNPLNGEQYLEPCFELVKQLKRDGLHINATICTSLLTACAKASNLTKANDVWSKMLSQGIKPGVVQHNAMLEVILSVGDFDKASNFLKEMTVSGVKPNLVTYRIFMSYLSTKKSEEEAQKLFNVMKGFGVYPDKGIHKQLNALNIL